MSQLSKSLCSRLTLKEGADNWTAVPVNAEFKYRVRGVRPGASEHLPMATQSCLQECRPQWQAGTAFSSRQWVGPSLSTKPAEFAILV